VRVKSIRDLDFVALLGVPAAIGIVVLAQRLEGAPVRALWQPTAALVVFGGTFAAVCVSYPLALIRRTVVAIGEACIVRPQMVEPVLQELMKFAQVVRRKGVIALESELDRVKDPFLKTALSLAVDGTPPKTSKQILEVESDARLQFAEGPAEVLEAAAGYTPTLGILGAVLGLIHVMQSLSDPSKLGSGIAVAFVATVYGVAAANLVLLPLATRLRGLARQAAVTREIVIEGMSSVQEGLNPKVLEQKLRGFLAAAREANSSKKAA
jgi:chemotaxis protein MotA